jgi:hypothetical protein
MISRVQGISSELFFAVTPPLHHGRRGVQYLHAIDETIPPNILETSYQSAKREGLQYQG